MFGGCVLGSSGTCMFNTRKLRMHSLMLILLNRRLEMDGGNVRLKMVILVLFQNRTVR